MATEKLAAGGVSSWTDAGATQLNSLASGNAIQSAVVIDNTSNLDVTMDMSLKLGSITPTGVPYLGLYLYPLNDQGTFYGDNRFGSAAAGPPSGQYFVGSIPLVAAAQTQYGFIYGIPLPRWKFVFVFYNGSGVTLASSGNTINYQTTNRSVA